MPQTLDVEVAQAGVRQNRQFIDEGAAVQAEVSPR
jgi:hypothetical protein